MRSITHRLSSRRDTWSRSEGNGELFGNVVLPRCPIHEGGKMNVLVDGRCTSFEISWPKTSHKDVDFDIVEGSSDHT